MTIVTTLLFLYFLPAIIAGFRRHSDFAAIVAVNVFLGWTLVGWVVALAWSLKSVVQQVYVQNMPQVIPSRPVPGVPATYTQVPAVEPKALANEKDCPHCLSRIPAKASVCRYCQRDVA